MNKSKPPAEVKPPVPSEELYNKYREALHLYITTKLSCPEICRQCGVNAHAFRHFIRRYYPQHIRPGNKVASQYHKNKKQATKKKYKEAVKLYAETDLTIKQISKQTGVSINGFQRYIYNSHRDLLMRRNNLDIGKQEANKTRLRRRGTGQTLTGHLKYKDAIAACDDEKYIEYNVAQIARMFNLNATALGHQLRIHYPEILHLREQERMRRGLNDNQPRGARPWCVKQYAEAIEMLRNTDKTIQQVADECNVSFSGLKLHLLQYHKDIVKQRAEKRNAARRSIKVGELNGAGVPNQPKADKTEQYREAVEIYRTTLLPIKDIAEKTGVSINGLTHHLYRWHRNLVLKRKGMRPDGDKEYMNLRYAKRHLKSTKIKYSEAIQQLKSGKAESIAQVAAQFGYNQDSFRDYIHRHAPRLAKKYGTVKLKNGKVVLQRSYKKYAEAIRLYQTTTESLKSIAQRLGLVYASLGGFIRLNFPEVIEEHNALVAKSNL